MPGHSGNDETDVERVPLMRLVTNATSREFREEREPPPLVVMNIPASADSVGPARRRIASILAERCQEETVDTAALVVSELLTNAIRHSRPGQPITLTLAGQGDRLRIEVADAHPAPPRDVVAGEDDENGRGLFLCRALASGYGWRPLPGGGKALWVDLAVT